MAFVSLLAHWLSTPIRTLWTVPPSALTAPLVTLTRGSLPSKGPMLLSPIYFKSLRTVAFIPYIQIFINEFTKHSLDDSEP